MKQFFKYLGASLEVAVGAIALRHSHLIEKEHPILHVFLVGFSVIIVINGLVKIKNLINN